MARPDSLVKLLVGKLGSGKSAYAVFRMLEALMAGEVVVTNLELIWVGVEAYCRKRGCRVSRSNYRYVDSEEINERPAVLLEHLTKGSCLVIDEVHLWLGARAWRENQKKATDFQDFLTQARKLDVDCYLISQDERNVDSLLTRQATHIVRLTNWHHFPMIGKLLPLPLTVARICEPDGTSQVGREWVWRPPVYKCYKTKQTFKSIELTGRKAAKVLGKRSKGISYGMMMVGVGLVLLSVDWVLAYRRRGKESEKAAKVEAQKPATVQKAPAVESSKQPEVVTQSTAPERPLLITRPERARIEGDLPSVYRLNGAFFTLVGGQRVSHGSFLIAGLVRGWRREGGTVLVNLDSDTIPQLRLFYVSSHAVTLYDYAGGVIRRPGNGIRPSVRQLAPELGALVSGGDGSAGLPGVKPPTDGRTQVFVPGKSGPAPQLVVPDSPARGIDPLQPSERLNAPAKPATVTNNKLASWQR